MDEPPNKKSKNIGTEEQNKCKDKPLTPSAKTVTSEVAKRGVSLRETDVGIRCYITSGFTPVKGIVKQRFSDFVVNEIDINGEVVRLTSTSTDHMTKRAETVCKDASDKSTSTPDTPESDSPLSSDILADLKSIAAGNKDKKSVKIPAPSEKDERRKLHLYVKEKFPSLCSNCIVENDLKYIEISLLAGNKRADRRDSTSNTWPKDKQHLHFVLYKEFKDTMEALDIISKYSGIKPQQFNFAGTKDRRAKTSQHVSAHRVNAEKLQKVNAKLRGMAMGNFEYSKNKIALGQLAGNHFKIVLRDVNTTEDNLQKAADSIRENGFINYFGMQRFGTTSIPTYQIGVHIIKGEFEKAVDLIMAPSHTDKPHVSDIKLRWTVGRDAKAVLDKLPRSFNIERRLMQGIVAHGKEKLISALDAIPRTTRLLYLHSYQSLLWNKVASLRIEKFGLELIIGDLVYVKKPPAENIEVMEAENEDESESAGESLDEPWSKPAVKHLTESDVKDYSIFDVVLPLPGYDVVLPDNEIKDVITKLLTEDDLTLECFKAKKILRQYRLPGSYRYLLVKPTDVSMSLNHYDDVCEELILSDQDVLNKKEIKEKANGKFQAAVLEFGLPSSTYATMLLREIMRTDTSAAHQTTLNSAK